MPPTDATDPLAAVQTAFASLSVREETRVQALTHLRRWFTESSFAPYQPMIRALIAAYSCRYRAASLGRPRQSAMRASASQSIA